ncbi:GIY-YIG nuclease family protein [Candidatus Saccharibacteria bacterium]|nr:MAG: GIY-YIG nuclease family protein [Candidatus Saccharibacteria bacterium]
MRSYYVYIMTNPSRTTLYIGVTNNLVRRIWEHQAKQLDGFTKKYNCVCLVYYEEVANALVAIEREKQLKGWSRRKKEELIDTLNPSREDLSTSLKMTQEDSK